MRIYLLNMLSGMSFASNRLLNDNKQSHICANFLQLDLQEVGRKIYRRNAYILHVTETICMIYGPVTLTRSSFPIVVHRYLMHIILEGPLSQKTKKITTPKHQRNILFPLLQLHSNDTRNSIINTTSISLFSVLETCTA